MYHDAPVEAAVAVHRHRNRSTAVAAPQEVSQRIIHEYQLHRVASFLLTGRDGAAGSTSANASAPAQHDQDEGRTQASNTRAPSCCQCMASSTTPASTAPYVRVALQFPDELLGDAVAVVSALQRILTSNPLYADAMKAKQEAEQGNGSAAPTAARPSAAGAAVSTRPPAMDNPHRPVGVVRLFVLADNTFGSCCPDEITAQHYATDCIVHFGDACMSRSTRLPVLYVQPAFHFDALVGNGESGGAESLALRQQLQGGSSLLLAETCVILGIVERVTATLHRRLASWSAEEKCDASAVVLRLTVVGTYPTKYAMQAAECRWTDAKSSCEGSDVAVTVDWPQYEQRDGIVPAPHRSGGVSNDSDADAAALQPTATEDEGWLVNGVRFHRLHSGQDTTKLEVQYFLFFGAAGSAALVHVLTAEQYNQFHYTDTARSFLEWDGGDEETAIPVVAVVNNTFGVDMDGAEAERQAVQALAHSVPLDDGSASKLTDCVSGWLSAVLSEGVAALLTGDYVVAQQALQRRVRQRAFNIESVRASTAIGVLVASLAIEGYYELTQQLHQLIRAYGKRSYVIYVGHLNEFKLANFVDTVDCFVAVACPYSRQSHFPEKRDNFMKPIVSPAELLVALTTSDDAASDAQYGMAAVYTTSFETALGVLRDAVQARKREIESRASGDAASDQRRREEEERWASNGVLVRAGGVGGGALTVQESSQGALARLYEREYVGLDPRVGQTPVQTEVMEGKHGIARGYAKEREEQHAEPPVSQYK